jgi:Beta-lactamase enzyme family
MCARWAMRLRASIGPNPLNTALDGDERDTTRPSAMLANLRTVLLGEALSVASLERLTLWMIADKVGDKRIRAGLPAGWTVAAVLRWRNWRDQHDRDSLAAKPRPDARLRLFRGLDG